MASKLVLVTGGARSGKSSFAARLAGRSGKNALFVATARADDEEMARRIRAHRESRPAHWRTLEAPRRVGAAVEEHLGVDTSPRQDEVVLVDCLGVLISNVLMDVVGDDLDDCQARFASIEREVAAEIDSLLDVLRRYDCHLIVVTNEVGLGLVPPYALGRAFRDLIGTANQALAARAEEVYLLVAGIPVVVKGIR